MMRAPLLRIEVAASEVLGGPAVAWIEPNEVIGLVARGEPGTFLRTALLPLFQRLDAGAAEASANETLPAMVSTLAATMREAHDLLWRENQIGNVAWADALAFALAGEKLYLLATGESAAYTVLGGRVYPLATPVPGAAGLGRGNKARIEITSIDVAAGQRVVLVAAGARPDELAIAQLFGERLDLQRACDGLLPLTAGADGGAGVVALSFVPLPHPRETVPEGPFPEGFVEELESALEEGARAADATEEPVRNEHPQGVREAPPAREGAAPTEPAPRPGPLHPMAKRPPGEIPEPASNVVPFLESLATEPPPAAPPRQDMPPAAPARGPHRPLTEVKKPRPAPLAVGIIAGIVSILAVILVLAGPGTLGPGGRWKQVMHVMQGGGKDGASVPETYVAVRSEPAGATVSIDGHRLAQNTPTPDVGVEPGKHRVVVQAGEFGRWERTVDVVKGQGLTLNAAIVGNLTVSLVDTSRAVQMRLDGERIGRAPLTRSGLPVGEHRLEAFGNGLGSWSRPIVVTSADTVRVTVDVAGDEDLAFLSISSSILDEGGYQPSRGEAVYVDRERVGAAPIEHELEPGLHSVRVEHRGEPPWIEILDVRAGGTYFVRAEFGVERGLRIEHYPQEQLSSDGPVIVSAMVSGDPQDVTLYYQESDAQRGALAMTRIREGESLFVTAIPRAVLESGGLRYYIRARDRMSQESFTDVYDVSPEEPLRTAQRH